MTKSRDIASAIPAPSTISSAELGYLDGVTSAIQTQIDTKAPSSTAATLTGTQTLTNKTLTSPVLTTPSISTITTKGDLLGFDTALNRIPIGTNNQVLTADSAQALGLKWATPTAAAIDYTLINAGGTALSGAVSTTVSVSGKNSILVIITGASSATGGTGMFIRPNANNSSANYNKWDIQSANATVSLQPNSIAGSSWFKLAQIHTATTDTMTGIFKIDGANATNYKPVLCAGTVSAQGSNSEQHYTQGSYAEAAAITSIQVTTLGANFSAGTIYVYGA